MFGPGSTRHDDDSDKYAVSRRDYVYDYNKYNYYYYDRDSTTLSIHAS